MTIKITTNILYQAESDNTLFVGMGSIVNYVWGKELSHIYTIMTSNVYHVEFSMTSYSPGHILDQDDSDETPFFEIGSIVNTVWVNKLSLIQRLWES